MSDILNIPLMMLKPIMINAEIDVLKQKFIERQIKGASFVMSTFKVVEQISRIQTFGEMVYFVMEGNDMTEDEAKTYISGLFFEKTLMYN